jgi:hypothetical protein
LNSGSPVGEGICRTRATIAASGIRVSACAKRIGLIYRPSMFPNRLERSRMLLRIIACSRGPHIFNNPSDSASMALNSLCCARGYAHRHPVAVQLPLLCVYLDGRVLRFEGGPTICWSLCCPTLAAPRRPTISAFPDQLIRAASDRQILSLFGGGRPRCNQ